MYGPGPDSGKAEAAGPYPSPIPPFPGAKPGGTSVRLGRPESPPPALPEEGTQGSRLRERKHGGACEPVGRDATRVCPPAERRRSPQDCLAVAAASLTTGSPPPALTEEGESKGPLLRERKKAACVIPSEETHSAASACRPRTINPRRAQTGLNGGTSVRTWALRGDPARPPHLSCYCFPKENVRSGPRFLRSPERSLAAPA